MTNQALQDYIFFSKYSRYDKNKKRKETFNESVDRIFDMHIDHLTKNYPESADNKELLECIDFAYDLSLKGIVFGSMRAFQFGGVPILKHNEKIYNCAYTYMDRPKAFSEMMFVLLCGCGSGLSVQYKHVEKLPTIIPDSGKSENFIIPDSIEGWSDAVDKLVNSYFYTGNKIVFDYSLIRPKGSLIAGFFKAPGPDGLRDSLEKMSKIFDVARNEGRKLKPIEVYSITCHIADAVLSGGIRRSALITLFSMEDEEMMKAKTGNWFYQNPHFARSNNSCVFIRGKHTKEQFSDVFNKIKEFGEPGFVFLDNEDVGLNPCAEIGLYPKDETTGESGFQFCNLCTTSGRHITNEEEFYAACKAMAIIGTIQASYNKFPYLGEVTERIVKRESLLGCSITGIMKNPSILTDERILSKGAEIILEYNQKIADILGIPHAARTTTIKPEGTSSALTGNSSGIHGEHARRYLRRAQVNKDEDIYKIFSKINPAAVKDSVFSKGGTDAVISFPIEAGENSLTKSQLLGVKQLEYVKKLKTAWVDKGKREELCVDKSTSHNVSNTITVDDWSQVENYIWDNKEIFTGISFLANTGDTKYNQAPFAEVLTPKEMLKVYGDSIMFASGLIVDILDVFGDLWKACDTALGYGEQLNVTDADVIKFMKENGLYLDSNLPYVEYISFKEERKQKVYETLIKIGQDTNLAKAIASSNDDEIIKNIIKHYLDNNLYCRIENLSEKRDIIRRIRNFAFKYFKGNLEKTTIALKHVNLYHEWCTIQRECSDINWATQEWSDDLLDADTQAGASCHSGGCEII